MFDGFPDVGFRFTGISEHDKGARLYACAARCLDHGAHLTDVHPAVHCVDDALEPLLRRSTPGQLQSFNTAITSSFKRSARVMHST